jgi:hypothetical protein
MKKHAHIKAITLANLIVIFPGIAGGRGGILFVFRMNLLTSLDNDYR